MAEHVARYLAFTLFVGAAVADATPQQREQLRLRVLPQVADLRASNAAVRPILETVMAVMGPSWQPTGDFRQFIDALVLKGE